MYNNILKVLILKILDERLHQCVHPCMLVFLKELIATGNAQAYYDGDHIKGLPESANDFPLYEYGYKHLISSFRDLNDLEKLLLKAYCKEA